MMSVDSNSVTQLARATIGTSSSEQTEFRTGRRTYTHQFDELYAQRLNALKPAVEQVAAQRWSKVKPTASVLNVDGSHATYVVGTLFIDSGNKPSTLHQVENERWITDVHGTQYREAEDVIVYLEDESGRIRLVGDRISNMILASGIVAGVLGVETDNGDFEVADVCFAGMAPQKMRPVFEEDRFIVLVSGLGATPEQPVTLAMQLLAETLCGTLGASELQAKMARVAQVVLVGDTIHVPPAPLGHADDARANDRAAVARLAAQVDDYLADIAACMPLVIMPGAKDPADTSLPQQPLPLGLFRRCAQYSGFSTVTNPTTIQLDGLQLLGSSGQNIDDLSRYSKEPAAKLAVASLRWRHLAPTAPDTLWCYPFTTHDPFVLTSSPHVYFIGSQSKHESVWTQGEDGQETRVVMVPRFSDTSQVVLLNMRTLECSTLDILS
ncbi:DNA polymerase delta small subunit Cdc1 [Coemansia sp. RSA 2703]|nr:DNA polymerase delta small subunit Cdc1 [Coemansia sp. RSA 2703]KAJ2385743.1 DNA polymerase delta small subunit Cdc1 [Coemansia sp. RSA 2603]